MDSTLLASDQATIEEIREEYGDWTAHNIRIGDEFTFGRAGNQGAGRHRRILQVARDVLTEPPSSWRVLDLACLEGMSAIEFGRLGAESLGIDIREQNIAKARFAANAIGLSNTQFEVDDVREATREKYGEFNVVVCSGILYHLDSPDCFKLVQNLYSLTTRLAIIDTRISLDAKFEEEFAGKTYSGRYAQEHAPGTSDDEKKSKTWLSIDNERAFIMTKASLLNLLQDVGFTSVLEAYVPVHQRKDGSRVCFLALKGNAEEIPGSSYEGMRDKRFVEQSEAVLATES